MTRLLPALSLALVVACTAGPVTPEAGQNRRLNPTQSGSETVFFTSFEEVVATADAVAQLTVGRTVERIIQGDTSEEGDLSVTRVHLRLEEQLDGERSLPSATWIGTVTDFYGDEPTQWPEWRTEGQQVVVFFGHFPKLERAKSRNGWEQVNSQGIFMLNGDDLEATHPDDELTAEIASWTYDEFRERLEKAAEEAEAGRVTPQPDPRKNPPSPQIDGESSEQASPPPPGPDEEPGARP